jgi:hypothetical protein
MCSYDFYECMILCVCLVRVNLTQSATLNIFISREAEYEQRAQLLKRLSYVIFCSEMDQYQRQMPEIQGL